MAEIITLIIFIGSLCGIGVILFRKIPALKALPIEKEKEGAEYFSDIQEKIKQVNPFGFTCFEKFLKKFLLRVRIFGLKIENVVNSLLRKMREKQERKNNFSDNSKEEYSKEENSKEDDENNDIENIKDELKNQIETESAPEIKFELEPEMKSELEIEPKIEKDNYWEELKKFKKEKTTRRKVARKKKISK